MYSDIGRSGVRGVALIVSGVRRSSLLDEQDAATGLSPFRRHTHTTPRTGIADYLEQRSRVMKLGETIGFLSILGQMKKTHFNPRGEQKTLLINCTPDLIR